jgi:hypothetical protein
LAGWDVFYYLRLLSLLCASQAAWAGEQTIGHENLIQIKHQRFFTVHPGAKAMYLFRIYFTIANIFLFHPPYSPSYLPC